jgi:hypothetical protein
MRHVIALDSLIASTCPAVAAGGEGPLNHTNLAGILERLVVREKGRRVGDGVDPHAAEPGGDAVEQGAGAACGPEAHKLLAAVHM